MYRKEFNRGSGVGAGGKLYQSPSTATTREKAHSASRWARGEKKRRSNDASTISLTPFAAAHHRGKLFPLWEAISAFESAWFGETCQLFKLPQVTAHPRFCWDALNSPIQAKRPLLHGSLQSLAIGAQEEWLSNFGENWFKIEFWSDSGKIYLKLFQETPEETS